MKASMRKKYRLFGLLLNPFADTAIRTTESTSRTKCMMSSWFEVIRVGNDKAIISPYEST